MEQELSTKGEARAASAGRFTPEVVFMAVCLVCAFAVRWTLMPAENVIGWDGAYYALLGEKLYDGRIYDGISAYWSPLYSFVIAIFMLVWPNSETAGLAVSLVAGSLLIVPVFYLIRAFYGLRPAYIGTILAVIHPTLVRSSMWVMTEALYTLIFTVMLLVFWRALRERRTLDFLLVGALFGLAYLLKPEVVGFLGLVALLLAGVFFYDRRMTFRIAARGLAVLLLGFAVFLLPYVGFLYHKTGRITISQKLLNNFSAIDYGRGSLQLTDDGRATMKDQLFGDLYETETPAGRPSERPPETADERVAAPPTSLRLKGFAANLANNFKKLVKNYTPELFPVPVLFLLLIIVSFFYRPWSRSRAARETYLLSFVVCTYLGYSATVIQGRYLLPILPIFIAWIAHGLTELSDWAIATIRGATRAPAWFSRSFAQAAMLLVVCAAMVQSMPSQLWLESTDNMPIEEKRAGQWIAAQTPAPALIMAHSPIVAYYARTRHVYVPDEDFATLIEYARRQGVGYLVFSRRRYGDTTRAELQNEERFAGQIERVYADESGERNSIYIYRLTN